MVVDIYKHKITLKDVLLGCDFTKHAEDDRHKEIFDSIELNNDAEVDMAFFVDKGHTNGNEIHAITKSAIIFIINYKTKKLITTKNARPGQLKQYYEPCTLTVPPEILIKAKENITNANNIR